MSTSKIQSDTVLKYKSCKWTSTAIENRTTDFRVNIPISDLLAMPVPFQTVPRTYLRDKTTFFQACLIWHLTLLFMEELQNISKLQFVRISLLPIRNSPSPAGTVARQQSPCNAEHHWALPVCCHWDHTIRSTQNTRKSWCQKQGREAELPQQKHLASGLSITPWLAIAVWTSCIFNLFLMAQTSFHHAPVS